MLGKNPEKQPELFRPMLDKPDLGRWDGWIHWQRI